MVIKVVNKINKEYGSLTTLSLGEQEFPLTEKDLFNLIYQLNLMRDDVVKEAINDNSDNEISELKEKVSELESDLEESEDRVSELEDILDEEGIDY